MNAADLVLGIDLGTTGLKGGVFDGDGRCLALAGHEYALDQPRPTWAEQPAERWWDALVAVLSQLRQRVDTRAVTALAVVGQAPTIVPIGRDGRALRPAITWADRRSQEQAHRLAKALDGEHVNLEFDVLPRVLWIRDEEPGVYDATAAFLHPHEYLVHGLTGVATTVEPLEGLPPWTDRKLAAAGLDRDKFPAEMVGAGRRLGQLAPGAAAELGLSPTASVVSGTVDAFAHWIGVNLSRPGVMSNIGGTSEGYAYATLEEVRDPHYRLFPMRSPFGRGWILGGAGSNSGTLLDWTVRTLYGESATYEAVLGELAAVAPGSEALLALPYFRGERTPIYDEKARGTFVGLTYRHGRAHLGRALLEGVAYGARQVIDIVEQLGGHVEQLVVSGGGARAHVWNRIKADVTGKPVHVPTVTQSGVLGAAILARAADSGRPLHEVAAAMVHDEEVIEPDLRSSALYQDHYPIFRDLYARLGEPFRQLAEVSHRN